MFRENNPTKQTSFSDYDYNLSDKRKKQLENGWPGKFRDNIFYKIDELKFAPMYHKSLGAPNFPVNILIGLEVLKQLFDVSDLELFELFHFDVRYLKAFDIKAVGDVDLADRTYYNFRERVVNYINDTGHNPVAEVFDELVENFIEVADLDIDVQRMDSTLIEANIKHLSRIQLMRKVLSDFIEKLNQGQKNRIHKNTLKILDDKEFDEYLDALGKEKVLNKLLGKLNSVKEHFKNDTSVNQTRAYQQLERVIEDQSIMTSRDLIAKDDSEIEPSSLQNPYDEDATYRKKGKKSSQGYALNITETANPDNPAQMITDVSLKANIFSDPKFLQTRLPEIKYKTPLKKLIVDGSYYGPDSLKIAAKEEVEIIPTALTGKTPKYSTAEFGVDDNNNIEHCPEGFAPLKTKYLEDTETIAAWFEKSKCLNCGYQDKCPVKEQKKNMTVRFKTRRYERDKLRAKFSDPEYKRLQKQRPAIEGTFSALKRSQGLNRFKTVGLIKNSCITMFSALGYNLKQLIKVEKARSKPSFGT